MKKQTTQNIEKMQSIKPFKYKCICLWSKDDEYGFIPDVNCPAHGKETRKKLTQGGIEV